MMKRRNQKVRRMTQLALLTAIILVMWQTPLGYLRTPVLSLSFLTVPVAVVAMLLGPAAGAMLGLVFGLTSFADTFLAGGMKAVLFGLNPLGCVVVTVGARVLCGWLCGLVFAAVNKLGKGSALTYAAGAFSCPFLNTVFFMGFIMLFYYNTDYIQGFCVTYNVSNPFALVLAMVGLQGAIELVVCGAMAAVIGKTVAKFLR